MARFIMVLLITLDFFGFIGIVGGMDAGNIPMGKGFIVCIAVAGLSYILFAILNKIDKYERD